MIKKTRSDGTLIKGLHYFTRMVPYLMPTRTESTIFFEQEFDVGKTLEYIVGVNKDSSEKKITFFQIFLCALVRTIALRPDLNRFISGFNIYQRNQIIFSFVAKKELTDEGEEINVTIPFSPFETLETISEKISRNISKCKSGEGTSSDDINATLMKLPRPLLRAFFWFYRYMDFHNILPSSLIKSDPMYVTSYITNVGSVGIDAPFHHNFERGTCGIFVALGKIKTSRFLDKEGKLKEKEVVKVTFTYDDRIKDGIYCARSIDLFRDFVENPEKLEIPPDKELVDLKRHMLKEETAK